MNKDALLATLIGFGIGLLITGFLLLSPYILKAFPMIQLPRFSFLEKKTEVPPTPTPAALTVTIDSPLPDAIEEKDEVLMSGATKPGSAVVVAGPLDEVVVVANGEGKFAGKVSLAEGKNDISVTAYEGSQQSSAAVTVFYTPEQL